MTFSLSAPPCGRASELGLGLGLKPVENKQEETFQTPRKMRKGKLIDPDVGSDRNNVQYSMTDKIKKDANAPGKTGALL